MSTQMYERVDTIPGFLYKSVSNYDNKIMKMWRFCFDVIFKLLSYHFAQDAVSVPKWKIPCI